MQIFSCVNLCDVILAYLEFLPSCKDYMLEKIFEINSNRVYAHNMLPLYSGACNRFLSNRSHVVIEAGGCEFNHALALSFIVKGKSLRRIASSDTPLYLKVSQISKKLAM